MAAFGFLQRLLRSPFVARGRKHDVACCAADKVGRGGLLRLRHIAADELCEKASAVEGVLVHINVGHPEAARGLDDSWPAGHLSCAVPPPCRHCAGGRELLQRDEAPRQLPDGLAARKQLFVGDNLAKSALYGAGVGVLSNGHAEFRRQRRWKRIEEPDLSPCTHELHDGVTLLGGDAVYGRHQQETVGAQNREGHVAFLNDSRIQPRHHKGRGKVSRMAQRLRQRLAVVRVGAGAPYECNAGVLPHKLKAGEIELKLSDASFPSCNAERCAVVPRGDAALWRKAGLRDEDRLPLLVGRYLELRRLPGVTCFDIDVELRDDARVTAAHFHAQTRCLHQIQVDGDVPYGSRGACRGENCSQLQYAAGVGGAAQIRLRGLAVVPATVCRLAQIQLLCLAKTRKKKQYGEDDSHNCITIHNVLLLVWGACHCVSIFSHQ